MPGGRKMCNARKRDEVSDSRKDGNFGAVTQLGEYLFCKQKVVGSNPASSTEHIFASTQKASIENLSLRSTTPERDVYSC